MLALRHVEYISALKNQAWFERWKKHILFEDWYQKILSFYRSWYPKVCYQEEAFEYLSYELDYGEAELEGVLEERPSHTGLYDPVSLAD